MGESQTIRIIYKWVGFVCAMWIQSIAGNNYTFANYASDLKHVMDYSQLELNTLSVAKDVGKSLGLMAGILSEHFPPQVILLIGAVEGVLGYGSTWLVISQHVAPPSLWQMSVVMFLGGNSSTWMNTACLTTCLRNFPESRGPVTGILKGFVGLSTAIFTVVCSSVFTGASGPFVLLLAFVPLIVCLIGAIFLREVAPSTTPEEDLEERTSFRSLNIAAIATAIYLLGYTLIEEALPPSVQQYVSGVLLLCIISPIIVPARLLVSNWSTYLKRFKKYAEFGYYGSKESNSAIKEPLVNKMVLNVSASESQRENPEDFVDHMKNTDEERELALGAEPEGTRNKQLGDNYTSLEALMSPDFWLLFLGFFTGVGAGMTTINNVAQIGGSLGFVDCTLFVSLISISGFFGRLLSGTLSEYYFRSRGIPRTTWMAASKILMIIGFFILAFPTPGALYIGSIILGFCFGFHVTITVPVASEMFGLKSFGVIFNVLNLDISLGSFVFSYLAGYIYDYESTRTSNYPGVHERSTIVGSNHTVGWSDVMRSTKFAHDEEECYGSHCFELVFLIMSLVLAVGFILDATLTFRLRPLYRKLAQLKAEDDSESRKETSVTVKKPEVC